MPFSISMRRDGDFGSEDERSGLHWRHEKIEVKQIGFLSANMGRIYSPEGAMIDLLGVMQSESAMETNHRSKDQGDDLQRIRKHNRLKNYCFP